MELHCELFLSPIIFWSRACQASGLPPSAYRSISYLLNRDWSGPALPLELALLLSLDAAFR